MAAVILAPVTYFLFVLGEQPPGADTEMAAAIRTLPIHSALAVIAALISLGSAVAGWRSNPKRAKTVMLATIAWIGCLYVIRKLVLKYV